MRVLRITNPSAMDLEPMQDLLGEVSDQVIDSPSKDDMLDWFRKNLEDDRVCLLVATEGGLRFQGLAVLSFFTDLWNPYPWAGAFYSRKRDARKALAEEMRRIVAEAGFDRVRAINGTGASDRAYATLWRQVATVRVVGPAVELVMIPLDSLDRGEENA